MHWSWLIVLLMGAFALAPKLESGFRHWSQRKAQPQSVLAAMMGDSRRLFANHVFLQSDVYLHGGYYPGMFDRPEGPAHEENEHEDGHDTEEHDHVHGPACQHDFLGKPRNWLDAFGRNFFPSQHTHLGEGKSQAVEAREILPWLKLAAELDPEKVDTYTVGAYWLRQMGKSGQALQFLREGQRANPDSYEILFEIGQCHEDNHEIESARHLWELALRRWQEQQAGRPQLDRLAGGQILGRLARLEARDHQRDRALRYLEMLKQVSPTPDEVQKRIEDLKAGRPIEAETHH
jgi:tetratricopeptide (TPR) repeat protein